MGIFKLRLKNQNQYVNDHNFPKIMMTKMMKMTMIMMMMIIMGTCFNNTEKTISSIFRPVARKNPCDLCISLTFLKRLSRLFRMNEKRGSE